MAAKRKLKLLAHRIFSTMLSLLLHGRRTPLPSSSSGPSSGPVQRGGCPPPPTTEDQTTLVVDVDTALLRSGDDDDMFPYFMLVALEAGGFLRGLLLLLLYPLLFLLAPATTTRAAMAFVAFCGLRASRFRAGRAVLPKWFMDDVAAEAFEAVVTSSSSRRVVCVSRGMPRVMVDGFLREYLGADAVVGREMKTLWGFYTGLFMLDEEELVLTNDGAAAAAAVGLSGSSEFLKHPLARSCKVLYRT
jgi:glycerol-3-phosphate acyltransferase